MGRKKNERKKNKGFWFDFLRPSFHHKYFMEFNYTKFPLFSHIHRFLCFIFYFYSFLMFLKFLKFHVFSPWRWLNCFSLLFLMMAVFYLNLFQTISHQKNFFSFSFIFLIFRFSFNVTVHISWRVGQFKHFLSQ